MLNIFIWYLYGIYIYIFAYLNDLFAQRNELKIIVFIWSFAFLFQILSLLIVAVVQNKNENYKFGCKVVRVTAGVGGVGRRGSNWYSEAAAKRTTTKLINMRALTKSNSKLISQIEREKERELKSERERERGRANEWESESNCI